MEVFSHNLFPANQEDRLIRSRSAHMRITGLCSNRKRLRRARAKARVPTHRIRAEICRRSCPDRHARDLEREILPDYLRSCRWFGAKARTIRELQIIEQIPISRAAQSARVWFSRSELYRRRDGNLLAARARSRVAKMRTALRARRRRRSSPIRATATPSCTTRSGIPIFAGELFRIIREQRSLQAQARRIVAASATAQFAAAEDLSVEFAGAECRAKQFVDAFRQPIFLKLYRKLEDGVNPDVEITRFLTERRHFPHVPAFVGALEYRRPKTSRPLSASCKRLSPTKATPGHSRSMQWAAITSASWHAKPICRRQRRSGPLLEELIGGIYPEKARLLGQRTGRVASRACLRHGRSRLRARAVQRDGAAFRLSIDARFARGAPLPCCRKKLADIARSIPRRSRGSPRARRKQILAQEQRILEQHSAAAQDPDPWRLSSRPGALYRKDFVIPRFRRRTGAAAERTKTEAFRVCAMSPA